MEELKKEFIEKFCLKNTPNNENVLRIGDADDIWSWIEQNFISRKEIEELLKEQRELCSKVQTLDKEPPFRNIVPLSEIQKEAIINTPSPLEEN